MAAPFPAVRIRCVSETDPQNVREFESIAAGTRFLREMGVEEGSFKHGIQRALQSHNAYRGYFWSRMENVPQEIVTRTPQVRDPALDLILDNANGARVRVTDENPRRVSVFDLIKAITGARNSHSSFERMCAQYPEVLAGCESYEFPGQGQRPTPVTDARGAVMIMNLLPGPAAARFRQTSADIVVRFLGGDETLIAEIQANHELQERVDDNNPIRLFGEAVEQRGERYQLTSQCMEGKYLDSFIGKRVVYLIVFRMNDQTYIKFGKSEVVTDRIDTHYNTYPNANIYCMYEVDHIKKIEDAFKAIVRYRNRLTDVQIRGMRHTEIVRDMDPSEAEEILQQAIEDMNHTGWVQVRLADIKLREKEIECETRQKELEADVRKREIEMQLKMEMLKVFQLALANSGNMNDVSQICKLLQ